MYKNKAWQDKFNYDNSTYVVTSKYRIYLPTKSIFKFNLDSTINFYIYIYIYIS